MIAVKKFVRTAATRLALAALVCMSAGIAMAYDDYREYDNHPRERNSGYYHGNPHRYRKHPPGHNGYPPPYAYSPPPVVYAPPPPPPSLNLVVPLWR